MNATRQRGYTTPELILVLMLLGIVAGLALPGVMRAVDVLLLRAARDAVVAAAAQARALAMAQGGGYLRVDEAGVVDVLARADLRVEQRWDLRARYGVTLEIENSARTIALLEFDALGIGRLANLTIRLRRRQTEGGVTFSAYGRPRPW